MSSFITGCVIWLACALSFVVFFFNDTATTEIYTLSLHDALPIRVEPSDCVYSPPPGMPPVCAEIARSEEHTSELQSQSNLVCRLLLEKKKKLHPPQTRHP